MSTPRGYFSKVLALDCETSGFNFNAFGEDISKGYQSLSWGLVVADENLKPVDELYIELQYDGVSTWNKDAENVHGLSKEYLAKNGVTTEKAVEEIANFLITYWNPNGDTSAERNIRCLGQNIATFDVWFMIKLFADAGADDLRREIFKTGNRFIDTSSIGYIMGCYNSDDLFELVGVHRDPNNHNALEDAKASLSAVRKAKKMFNLILGE